MPWYLRSCRCPAAILTARLCLSAPSSVCCFDDSRLALYISVGGLVRPLRYFRPNGHQRGRRCFISDGAVAAAEAVSAGSGLSVRGGPCSGSLLCRCSA